MSQWRTVLQYYANVKCVHVIPIDDLREHEEEIHCWCVPKLDGDEFVMVHNAADGREDYETGARKPS